MRKRVALARAIVRDDTRSDAEQARGARAARRPARPPPGRQRARACAPLRLWR